MTLHLIDKLEHCMTKSNLSQSSNHILIFTRILYDIESNLSQVRRRVWKLIDLKKVKKIAKNFLTLLKSISTFEIDEYVEKMQKFL
jgi:hypothetical protein